MLRALGVVLPVVLGVCTAAPTRTVVDLTHSFSNQSQYWPGADSFKHLIGVRGPYGVLPWYEGNNYEAAEHGGTHMDAPAHFHRHGWRVDDIPPERLIGPALVVDIREKTRQNSDYRLTQRDLTDWEDRHGQIEEGSILLILTGWYEFYTNRTKYFGSPATTSSNLHFPGIHPDAARWIAQNRKPSGVGLDTPSLDYGPSTDFQTHRVLFAENMYGLENVARLNELPTRGSTLYVAVMKIEEGSGGPVRLLAVLDNITSSADSLRVSLLLLFIYLLF